MLRRPDAIVPTEFEGLHLISADKNLVGANLELVDLPDREFRLRERIASRSATIITSS